MNKLYILSESGADQQYYLTREGAEAARTDRELELRRKEYYVKTTMTHGEYDTHVLRNDFKRVNGRIELSIQSAPLNK